MAINRSNDQSGPRLEDLCLTCGLCCNGVIFADVKLHLGDNPRALAAMGLPIMRTKPRPRASSPGQTYGFPQPCAALEGCRCRIYRSRPQHCCEFECLLLQQLKFGKTSPGKAERLVRTALNQAQQVRTLLRALGDHQENLPLADRYRRLAKALAAAESGPSTGRVFSRLTLAMHKLSLTLSRWFYPGNIEQ